MREGPEVRARWRRVPWTTSWRPAYVGASIEAAQAYSDGASTVELFLAISQDQERKLIGFQQQARGRRGLAPGGGQRRHPCHRPRRAPVGREGPGPCGGLTANWAISAV